MVDLEYYRIQYLRPGLLQEIKQGAQPITGDKIKGLAYYLRQFWWPGLLLETVEGAQPITEDNLGDLAYYTRPYWRPVLLNETILKIWPIIGGHTYLSQFPGEKHCLLHIPQPTFVFNRSPKLFPAGGPVLRTLHKPMPLS